MPVKSVNVGADNSNIVNADISANPTYFLENTVKADIPINYVANIENSVSVE